MEVAVKKFLGIFRPDFGRRIGVGKRSLWENVGDLRRDSSYLHLQTRLHPDRVSSKSVIHSDRVC